MYLTFLHFNFNVINEHLLKCYQAYLINLRKLAEQQKEQRAIKIKNRILKQTHDIKIAENLSHISKKLDEVKKTTQELGDIIKVSNTPQPAIENTPQPAIENTPEPLEINEGVTYDVELENSLNIMNDNTGFFKTTYDRENGWMLNIHPVKMSGGTENEINNKKYNITQGIQKVFTDTSYNTAKSMNDKDKLVFRDILQKADYYKRLPTKRRMSGRDSYIKFNLVDDVSRNLNLDTKPKTKPKLKGRGVEKIIIPSNIIDIYTRLEILLGLKLSGHTDTLTEASAVLDELYKRGEIQNKQPYRNDLNKFSSP